MTYIQNLPIQFNTAIPQIGFRGAQGFQTTSTPLFQTDKFVSNPAGDIYGSKEEIEASARFNPRIMAILNENNIPLKVNENTLNDLKRGHLQETRVIAAKMYSALPADMKNEVNLTELQDAAMFHDYGKVLIPDKILNKAGALNDKEWAIMQKHSELGAELIKDKGLSKHTVELVKYHHQNKDRTGYPAVNGYYDYGIDSQILSAADKYTALTEKRAYKNPLSREDSFAVLEQDVKNGDLSPEVFDALKKAVN